MYLGDIHGHSSVKYDLGCGQIEVQACRLDKVLDSLSHVNQLDWVKIDVEGAEYEVLEGLTKHLVELSPRLIVEVLHGNKNRVLKFMEKVGYESFLMMKDPSDQYYYCLFSKCGGSRLANKHTESRHLL